MRVLEERKGQMDVYFLITVILKTGYSIGKASLVAQTVKNLRAMQETWVRSLGGEDPQEKEMAIHSSFIA